MWANRSSTRRSALLLAVQSMASKKKALQNPSGSRRAFTKDVSLFLLDVYWLKQLEMQRRLRRKRNVAITSESRTTGACCGAYQTSNDCTLPAAGQSADQRSTACATANHGCRALAFAFAGHRRRGSLNLVLLPIDSHARQRQGQHGATLKPPGGFRLLRHRWRRVCIRAGWLVGRFTATGCEQSCIQQTHCD